MAAKWTWEDRLSNLAAHEVKGYARFDDKCY